MSVKTIADLKEELKPLEDFITNDLGRVLSKAIKENDEEVIKDVRGVLESVKTLMDNKRMAYYKNS